VSDTDEYHKLFRAANSPTSDLRQLEEIVDRGDELLSASVALNPSCSKSLLDKLAISNDAEVKRNLRSRFETYPELYSMGVREVKELDAEYLYSLRTNEGYSKYISKVSNGVEAQQKYIKQYELDNESKRTSFYFIFENKRTNTRCGTVRIYNFEHDKFEWGSWILDENKSRYAALETAILVYEFAFNALGFDKSEFEVNKENSGVVSYHKRTGAEVIGEDATNYYFRVTKEVGLACAKTFREKLVSQEH